MKIILKIILNEILRVDFKKNKKRRELTPQ